MIKFFRRIRQTLLSEGNTGKYLKYAIGEIVLVMIGILLALQVNEWNNERNRQKAEQAVIGQLRTDLLSSQAGLEDIRRMHMRSARMAAQVTRAFWKDEVPEDIEDNLRFGTGAYSPVLGTARSLINSGKIDLLSSAELKQDIISYVEEVDYTLVNIKRYRDTYFRDAVNLRSEAMPTTFESADEINERQQESDWTERNDYRKNLNTRPQQVDRVPFQVDINNFHNSKELYQAGFKMLLSHRNSAYEYEDLLEATNELLDKLNGITARSEDDELLDDHHIVFDSLDLQILQHADSLLSDSSHWSKEKSWACDEARSSGKYNLYCALRTASEEVIGRWERKRPFVRIMLFTLDKYEDRRVVQYSVQDWNNHPRTTFKDVKMMLKECIDIVEAQLKRKKR